MRQQPDRGSASLWVVAGGVLVLLVALVAVLRGTAVLARERAEAAADLAALAAADGIGVDGSTHGICARAEPIAAANQAHVVDCSVRLGTDGRTGTVDVTAVVRVQLGAVGAVVVHAHARAARLGWAADPTTRSTPTNPVRPVDLNEPITPVGPPDSAAPNAWTGHAQAATYRTDRHWSRDAGTVRTGRLTACEVVRTGPLTACDVVRTAGPVRCVWHDWSAAGLRRCAQPEAWRHPGNQRGE